jgi:hypothetical protein
MRSGGFCSPRICDPFTASVKSVPFALLSRLSPRQSVDWIPTSKLIPPPAELGERDKTCVIGGPAKKSDTEKAQNRLLLERIFSPNGIHSPRRSLVTSNGPNFVTYCLAVA